ncbi:unnamed protein product [Staurois parvus]|uniref:Uncharacterized protein n=1 Tax=Staurois parvus TaxID=386267 RepID=A0ABN9GG57_9NEOB|nr:unnamed protein product [Staurois parvus]
MHPGAYLPQGKQGICIGRHFFRAALPLEEGTYVAWGPGGIRERLWAA